MVALSIVVLVVLTLGFLAMLTAFLKSSEALAIVGFFIIMAGSVVQYGTTIAYIATSPDEPTPPPPTPLFVQCDEDGCKHFYAPVEKE